MKSKEKMRDDTQIQGGKVNGRNKKVITRTDRQNN